MWEEIGEQPAAIEETLREEWPRLQSLRAHFAAHPVQLIVLAARGTSDNAAQFGRYLLEITTGIPVSLAAASVVTLYDAEIKLKDAVSLGTDAAGSRGLDAGAAPPLAQPKLEKKQLFEDQPPLRR